MQKIKRIIKIGGSIFTDKNLNVVIEPEDANFGQFFNSEQLQSKFELLSKLNYLDESSIIVFGAGLYGHGLAKLHGLRSDKFVVADEFVVKKINQNLKLLFDELLKPVLTKFVSVDVKTILPKLIHQADNVNLVRICSGDEVVANLAKEFEPEKLIYCSDVPGVKLKNGWISKFSVGELPRILNEMDNLTESRTDVTGEMKNKLKQILDIKANSDLTIEFL